MVEQTSFEEPNARAEVNRYTYTPTYQLSYLLGKVLLLQLRADEQRRLGSRVRPARLPRHAAAQRLAADQLPPPPAARDAAPRPTAERRAAVAGARAAPDRARAGHPVDRPRRAAARGSSSGPASSTGVGAPTDRPERIAERFVEPGRAVVHLVDFDGARTGQPGNLEAVGPIASRVAVPIQVAGGVEGADQIRLAFAAGATRVVLAMASPTTRSSLAECLAVAGDWLAVGLDPRPDRLAAFPWQRAGAADARRRSSPSSPTGASAGSSSSHGGATPDLAAARPRSSAAHDVDVLVAGGVTDLDGIRRLRDAGVAGIILGEALLSGAIDFPAALEAAA